MHNRYIDPDEDQTEEEEEEGAEEDYDYHGDTADDAEETLDDDE